VSASAQPRPCRAHAASLRAVTFVRSVLWRQPLLCSSLCLLGHSRRAELSARAQLRARALLSVRWPQLGVSERDVTKSARCRCRASCVRRKSQASCGQHKREPSLVSLVVRFAVYSSCDYSTLMDPVLLSTSQRVGCRIGCDPVLRIRHDVTWLGDGGRSIFGHDVTWLGDGGRSIFGQIRWCNSKARATLVRRLTRSRIREWLLRLLSRMKIVVLPTISSN
jgi:hypothetical protein